MDCEQIRALMMDYLYDELSKVDREVFDSHLVRCSGCREEIESLITTSSLLQRWGEVESDIRVIAVREKYSILSKLKEFFNYSFIRRRKLVYGFVCAFTAIFLLLALSNTEISRNDGNFNMRMSFFNRPEQQAYTDIANSSPLVEELVRENFQLTRSLIAQSEEKQRNELAYVLSAFKKDIDEQRYQDLNLIKYGFNDLQKNTYQQIRQIDNTLNELILPADLKD